MALSWIALKLALESKLAAPQEKAEN